MGGEADATGSVVNGEYAVRISNGGSYSWDVSLNQTGLLIENGKTYEVSFDAYSDATRPIAPLIGMDAPPHTVYSGQQGGDITTVKQTYSFTFTMNKATDDAARIAFDVGASDTDLYIDNVVLKESGATWIEQEMDGKSDAFQLSQNYPNPFNPVTHISYGLMQASRVELSVYNMEGRQVRCLVSATKPAGQYTVQWFGKNDSGHPVASGVYVYRIQANPIDQALQPFVRVRKMLFIK